MYQTSYCSTKVRPLECQSEWCTGVQQICKRVKFQYTDNLAAERLSTSEPQTSSVMKYIPVGDIIKAKQKSVFYPDTLSLGEIASIGGRCWESGGCAPSGVQGQSPWSGGLGAKPTRSGKREAFCCISSLFLSTLEGTVPFVLYMQ